MEGAISIHNTNPSREIFASLKTSSADENNSLEYYQYLRERVEKSPLSFSGNPFFLEFSKEEKK